MAEKPHRPIPRHDSGAMAAAETDIGPLPSLRPIDPLEDHERRLRALEDGHGTLTSVVRNLEKSFEGQAFGIDAQIKRTVDAQFVDVKNHLGRQDVETKRQNGMLSELLDISREREAREQRKKLDSLHEGAAEAKLQKAQQEVFDGKGRKIRLWIKSAAVLVFIFVALGSALGISRCSHVHGVELPE